MVFEEEVFEFDFVVVKHLMILDYLFLFLSDSLYQGVLHESRFSSYRVAIKKNKNEK